MARFWEEPLDPRAITNRSSLVRILSTAASLTLFFVLCPAAIANAQNAQLESAKLIYPDAPEPQSASASPVAKPNPCVKKNGRPTDPEGPENTWDEELQPAGIPCTTRPLRGYQRFVNGPDSRRLTPRDKAWLAARNLVDPFNLITIAGNAAVSVAMDSHAPYGPGMGGFGRYVGVSFTQDLTGEFFGTFLIPSIAHQDPHYYRMPGHSIPRRALHAAAQVFWTRSDGGGGMPNFANLVGFPIEDEISNLYVPGRQTDLRATAQRYAIGLASAPIGNLINEFLPDVASHIHLQIVILQRVINQVARNGMSGAAGQPAE